MCALHPQPGMSWSPRSITSSVDLISPSLRPTGPHRYTKSLLKMDTNDPDAAQSLRLKIQEIDMKATQMRADGYRRILQSLMDEGTAEASMRSAPQPTQPRANVCNLTIIKS